MLIDIDKIVVGDRIRKDFGDIQELAEDIKQNTLLNALVVTPNGEGTYLLIAGERRLRACKSLGYKAVTVNVVAAEDAEQALRMEISENECRKEFTMTERLAYAEKLQSIKAAEAYKRMHAGKADPTPNSAEGQKGETRDVVAKAIGMGHDTLSKARFINDNSDLLDPAEFADWDEGKLSTNKAFQKIKAAQKKAEQERDAARRELDAAQQDLADAWQAQEDAETEVVVLKRKLESVEKPKPEVREVESKAARKRISELEHERDLYLDNVQKLRKRNEDMRAELDKAKDILGMDKAVQDVRRDVQYLITATNSYVRRYGGLTWTVQQLGEVDEPTLEQLRKAVRNLATFSNALMTSLEDANE